MAVVNNPTALRQVRQSNVGRVLQVLRDRGPRSRAEVGDATGLSRTTLSGIVGQLLADGVLVEAAEPRTGTASRGRPVQRLSLNPQSAQAVGIEVGRERIKVLVADAAHEVRAVGGTHCPQRSSARDQARAALRVLRELADAQGIELRAVSGVGIGTPGPGETAERAAGAPQSAGPPHPPAGHAESSPGAGSAVPRHRQLVADTVSQELGVPVLADNNTRLAALGEAIWGAARGAGDVLHVVLSYGVGGGLVTGGRLFRGGSGAAGEIGHISVDADGARCWCGGHGCMEQAASVPALLRAASRRSWERFTAALDAGEEAECAAVERAARAVGQALAASCSTVNPQRVVLGGEVAALGPVFLGPAEAAFRRYAPTRVQRGVPLVPAVLEDRGGALGALALVFQESPLLAGYTGPFPERPAPPAAEDTGAVPASAPGRPAV